MTDARSWELEVRLSKSQVDALARGATIRAGSQQGKVIVLVPDFPVEEKVKKTTKKT